MGYLQPGTVTKKGRIPDFAASPHLPRLKAGPTHGLPADCLSTALCSVNMSPLFGLRRMLPPPTPQHPCCPSTLWTWHPGPEKVGGQQRSEQEGGSEVPEQDLSWGSVTQAWPVAQSTTFNLEGAQVASCLGQGPTGCFTVRWTSLVALDSGAPRCLQEMAAGPLPEDSRAR